MVTELFCSQGTVRGNVPLAGTSRSDESWESLDLFYYLDVFFKLPKTTVEQAKLRHKSIWSAHVRTRWQEAGPVFFPTQPLNGILYRLKCHLWVFQWSICHLIYHHSTFCDLAIFILWTLCQASSNVSTVMPIVRRVTKADLFVRSRSGIPLYERHSGSRLHDRV